VCPSLGLLSTFVVCVVVSYTFLCFCFCLCASALPEVFCFFLVLICGGEVRSLDEVGGLVPLRFVVNPIRRHCTPQSLLGIRR